VNAFTLRPRPAWIFHLVLAAFLSMPMAASAQAEFRAQLAGSNVFPGDLHALFGVDMGIDIGGGDCRPGGPPCEVPNWTFLLAGYAGLVTDADLLSAYGHIGAERKLTDQMSVGAVGFILANPGQRGAALRVDAMDVAAFKVGYGWGDQDGMLVAVEIAWEFLRDLGR